MSKPVKMVNLTHHPIYEVTSRLEILPSKRIARVDKNDVKEYIEVVSTDGSTKEVLVVRFEYKDIVGLPEQRDGVMYIVSALILNALQEKGELRDDVVAPGKPIKDSKGVHVGCEGFRRNG